MAQGHFDLCACGSFVEEEMKKKFSSERSDNFVVMSRYEIFSYSVTFHQLVGIIDLRIWFTQVFRVMKTICGVHDRNLKSVTIT